MKIALNVEQLSVVSFDVSPIEEGDGLFALTGTWTCRCTAEVGCYNSKYCTGVGCVQTQADTCMTASNSPC
jgi:hypothetical protein